MLAFDLPESGFLGLARSGLGCARVRVELALRASRCAARTGVILARCMVRKRRKVGVMR